MANYWCKIYTLRPTRLLGYIRYERTDRRTDGRTDDNMPIV